jgi:hypothetical protein
MALDPPFGGDLSENARCPFRRPFPRYEENDSRLKIEDQRILSAPFRRLPPACGGRYSISPPDAVVDEPVLARRVRGQTVSPGVS